MQIRRRRAAELVLIDQKNFPSSKKLTTAAHHQQWKNINYSPAGDFVRLSFWSGWVSMAMEMIRTIRWPVEDEKGKGRMHPVWWRKARTHPFPFFPQTSKYGTTKLSLKFHLICARKRELLQLLIKDGLKGFWIEVSFSWKLVPTTEKFALDIL